VRFGDISFKATRALICTELGWTESEFMEQRWGFINEILIYMAERNKKQNGK